VRLFIGDVRDKVRFAEQLLTVLQNLAGVSAKVLEAGDDVATRACVGGSILRWGLTPRVTKASATSKT
jgi:hypothetical protein